MAKKVAAVAEKVKITFKIQLDFTLDGQFTELYLVGNTKDLGLWNPIKSVSIKQGKNGFTKTKTFNKNEEIEFKVLLAQTFDKVEVDENFSEIENHKVLCDESKTVIVNIKNFKM